MRHLGAMSEFSAEETHGFVGLESFAVSKTSKGLGWPAAYVSVQSVAPYAQTFEARPDILITVVNAGVLQAKFSVNRGVHSVQCPSGRITIFPGGTDFGVDLRSDVKTTHLYIRRSLIDEVASELYGGDPAHIDLLFRVVIFDPVLEQFCQAIRDVLEEDPGSSSLHVDYVARALAAHLVRKHSDAGHPCKRAVANGGLGAKQLGRVREVVEARLGERITTVDLVAQTGMSADHFGRLFKKTTGMTLYQYVIRARVERARRLLGETLIPVVEIAQECGFADQVHLTRAFRRVIGTTPAAFRREMAK